MTSLSAFLGTSLALAMALLAVAVTYLSERRIPGGSTSRFNKSRRGKVGPHGTEENRA